MMIQDQGGSDADYLSEQVGKFIELRARGRRSPARARCSGPAHPRSLDIDEAKTSSSGSPSTRSTRRSVRSSVAPT